MKLFGGNGKHTFAKQKQKNTKKLDFSKKLINDNRWLLWWVNIGGLLLAFYCVHKEYLGGLGWVAGMVSCAWAAHGAICSWYYNMAKNDHTGADGTGITYAIAQANGFADNSTNENDNWESPAI